MGIFSRQNDSLDATPDLLMEEEPEWVPIPYYEDYLIRKSSDIYDSVKGRQVQHYWGGRGYQVNLRDSRTRSGHTSLLVAAVLADIFIDDPNVDHHTLVFKDGDRRNHKLSNLAWRSRSYAIRYHKEITQIKRWTTNYSLIDSDDMLYTDVYHAAVVNGVWPSQIVRSVTSEWTVPLVDKIFYPTYPPEYYEGMV